MGIISVYFYGHVSEIPETIDAHAPICTNMQKESAF